jgi:hypothetical protein
MVEAGAQVLICYSHGEGASILLRVKALGLSFKGIFVTGAPGQQDWATYLGTDGDYVVTPGQWAADILAPCVLFGSAQNYSQVFKRIYGRSPNAVTATQTAAGMFLQLAMQVNSPSSHLQCHACVGTSLLGNEAKGFRVLGFKP